MACGRAALVAAFDRMMAGAHQPKAIQKVKRALFGFDAIQQYGALATLNMFFRGDGKSHLENISCFDTTASRLLWFVHKGDCLNPPFLKMASLREILSTRNGCAGTRGTLGCGGQGQESFDEDNANWRHEFTRNHSVLGMISLPDDLFYPTAAPTSILVAKAHVPQNKNDHVFMARIWNDRI